MRIVLLILIASCTPKPPYEVKSPCVSVKLDKDIHVIEPCVRRPINYAIT